MRLTYHANLMDDLSTILSKMLKQIIFATALCCEISTLAITSSIEQTIAQTPSQPSDQTSDWIYLSGNDRGKLYLSKNVARHPKQPSRVFYSPIQI